jgi:LacI family transcriptional regulator
MPKTKRIALALPLGVPHLERVVHGIHLYGREHAGWDFVTSPETHSIPVASLTGWDGDGVIAMVNTSEDLRVVRRLRCPVVNLSGALAEAGLPRVRVDYARAGQMAAEHLLSRGFDKFAYYGLRGVFYARTCLQGFRECLEQHNGRCSVYEDESTIGMQKPWRLNHAALDEWLRKLKPPVGLMASHDPRAVMVVQSCRRIGWRVPEDVAVIGLNNDIHSCEFSDPPLSSVSRPGEKIGLEAAALLDRLVRGHPLPPGDIVFPPEGVIERASTNTLALEDNEPLAEALRFIQQHLDMPMGVEDIRARVSVSRRWLEMAFKKKLRTTPHAYLSQLRLKKAKALVADSRKLRFKQVALDCGFSNTRQLNVTFQKFTGMSLRDYAAKVQSVRPRDLSNREGCD